MQKGLGTDESLNLLAFAPEFDFRGLLLAATIIGTLGVLDDVTITQVSAVWELHHSDPRLGARQLYSAGIRIGRDHIASTVNTLVLAYTAAALPTLLLLSQSGLAMGEVLTTETLAVEIVQTLVGSIGLVASVPLTTALASWVVTLSGREQRPERFDRSSHRLAVPTSSPATASMTSTSRCTAVSTAKGGLQSVAFDRWGDPGWRRPTGCRRR